MDKIKKMIIIALLLMIMPVGGVSSENVVDYDAYRNNWDLLYEDENDWVCLDYAVSYSRNNPGWGMVILSPSPSFKFQPHMANYKIDGSMLLIHEPQVNRTYELEIVDGTMTVPYYDDFPGAFSSQWARGTYFHFIPNETDVVRTYVSLKDNRGDFFDYENMSRDDITNITVKLDDSVAVVENGNNSSSMINDTTITNNTTADNHNLEKVNEPNSYSTKFIRFLKSLMGLF
ncbi:MAG: hypothetical protein SCH66_14395 [Methanolobus sp.]|nr:hypothetical protein [Methanolobus sp.]